MIKRGDVAICLLTIQNGGEEDTGVKGSKAINDEEMEMDEMRKNQWRQQ